MKIDDSLKKTAGLSVGTAQTRSSKGAEKAGSVAKAPSENVHAADSVHLSSQAQALAGQLAGSPVFDVKKVEEIKAAIAEGTFKVDAENVAAGLLDTVNDLLRSRKA